jgi:hypothetical protein
LSEKELRGDVVRNKQHEDFKNQFELSDWVADQLGNGSVLSQSVCVAAEGFLRHPGLLFGDRLWSDGWRQFDRC